MKNDLLLSKMRETKLEKKNESLIKENKLLLSEKLPKKTQKLQKLIFNSCKDNPVLLEDTIFGLSKKSPAATARIMVHQQKNSVKVLNEETLKERKTYLYRLRMSLKITGQKISVNDNRALVNCINNEPKINSTYVIFCVVIFAKLNIEKKYT